MSSWHHTHRLRGVSASSSRRFLQCCLQELCELGVVSGADMTVEAALTKLSFLLGQTHLSVHDVRKVTTFA